jgi:hypothetical protein
MWVGHVFEVCERISEAQVILHDQAEGAISSDAALTKLRALLSEPGLQEAIYHLGYFPKRPAAPGGQQSREAPQHTK